ncbi:M16 family metallopeptidase, partial [Sinosporangium siamense]
PNLRLPGVGAAVSVPGFAGGPRLVLVHREGAAQTHLAAGFGVAHRTGAAWAALTVAWQVLGGGLSSRLNAVLREDRGYTYGFLTEPVPVGGAGLLVAEGAVHAEVTGESLGLLLAEVRRLAGGGITADECASAVQALTFGAAARYETAQAVADALASAVGDGLPVDHVDDLFRVLRELDAGTVSAAVSRHMASAAPVVVAVGDARVVRGTLESLGFPLTVVG